MTDRKEDDNKGIKLNDCLTRHFESSQSGLIEGSACDSWPCWNEGICLPNGTKDYSCKCMEQFAGDHCQFRVSQLCTSARCTAGSICILDDLTVQCPPSSTDG
uniref:EGF-like domain-containing protein n=1 Tax=Heterorhabditis bacteriophora TaxID=37862 RepID=A0A1I7X654_HETBA